MIFRLDPPWIALLLPLPLWAVVIWWSYYFSFPILMERLVRRGKQWLYFPKEWRAKRAVYRRLSAIFFSATAVVTGVAIWWTFGSAWWLLLLLILLSAGAVVFLAQKVWMMRYQQQAALYHKRLQQHYSSQIEGESRISESEVRNKVSWEHQKFLHTVDQKGKLLELLVGEWSDQPNEEEQGE